MSLRKNTVFRKCDECPLSNDLLDFQNSVLPPELCDEIRDHIESCEFCTAELEFYSHYPQEETPGETVELTGIPGPLYELAEALLRNRHADASALNTLLELKKAEPLA